MAKKNPETTSEPEAQTNGQAVRLVSAGKTVGDTKVTAGVEFNFGTTLAETQELYGEEVCKRVLDQGLDRNLSNAIRSAIGKYESAGVSPDQITAKVRAELADWRPDVSRRRVAAPKIKTSDDLLSAYDNMSEEAQRAALEALMAKHGFEVA